MPKITSKLLDEFPYDHNVSPAVVQRGRQYFRTGHVYEIDYQGDYAVCQVEGNYDDYEVTIRLYATKQVLLTCTCPHAAQVPVCKHMVASMMALSQYLRNGEIPSDWERKLDTALENLPRRKGGGKARRYAAIFLLQEDEYYYELQFSLVPRIVKASRWGMLKIVDDDPAAVNRMLVKNHGWTKHLEHPYNSVNPNGCLNLPPEGVAFFNYLLKQTSYYSGYLGFSPFLPLLARMDAPIFLVNSHHSVQARIHVLSEPVELKAALARDERRLSLQAGIEHNGQLFTSAKQNLHIVSKNPPWVLIGDHLVLVSNPESLEMLSVFPLEIPLAEEENFRANYFPKLAELLPIESEIITWEDVKADAVPRLYLRKDGETLRAELRFGYGDHEARADRQPAPVSMADQPDSWVLTRIHRQPEREAEFYQKLKGAKYGLKRAGAQFPYGTFEIRARTHPYDFLTRCIPALTEAGFEIYGDKESLGKLNKNTPTINLNITSGIDWFDLDVVVQYGDQEVKLREIRKALKKGDRYIKLADGSIGQIPEAWLERYKHLFAMAEETEDGLRVSNVQLSLVDELLADAEEQNIAPEFHQKRERLKNLKDIAPQPVPKGFTGKLRPYQKAGLDWLHFLREYGFGGILADDMGLGKTIQMLAFLQSQREQAEVESAALLVVPKSLLTNWQRESAKFTPDLRILEYMGNFRNKNVETFKDYDIILTTYGTMLKDIEILREYRFSTVILDESQAIKNPLAKSAKAARLLNAEQRLAMTGTPVENNTFELWSQFAFVNPGLLGSMDYFKREFAAPIESRSDKATANLLKRMIYPFILRRTKEQVAPELPPRTERVVYTDLEPAQRKLYNRTRDYYRGQLLGLLDEGGMNNARMKILEGLLRLRQICIHPALVEPTYKKKAAKFEILLETLRTLQAEGHKALVFSQFVQALKLLEVEMKKLGLKYTYLDGKTRKRQAKVDIFQNDPSIPFFLISLKAGGVGLNLTAADYVVHLDPWWNPAVEMQAADRVHRIGQDKPVFVYKFIARETVEEKILELQTRKKELVKQLISAEGSFFKSLTRDDVKVLFS
ncbi:MAG: DEAD/DEAH box helicase family protein [Chloroflexi bacterium]|nr:DEAD/DEAH box helicase family protein [Chloroflexota bacterium]